jgi:hypothetical protein
MTERIERLLYPWPWRPVDNSGAHMSLCTSCSERTRIACLILNLLAIFHNLLIFLFFLFLDDRFLSFELYNLSTEVLNKETLLIFACIIMAGQKYIHEHKTEQTTMKKFITKR